jgi:DNA replication and repair protein RecF
MHLKEIRLRNFRNYEDEAFSFHEKVNIVIGKNGQGKSNLLEGIYLMSMGKSFRTNRDAEMIRFDADFFHVKGVFSKRGRDLCIEAAIGENEKRFKVNGLSGSRNADLLENAYMVAFSPEDLRIAKGEPEARRRFIDRELFQLRPLYYRNLAKYKKSMQQRNAALREEIPDMDVIDVWDEHMALYGARVMRERSGFIEKLGKTGAGIHAGITGGKESLNICYEASAPLEEGEEAQKEAFAESLRKAREKDIARRGSSVGPHRDDVGIAVNGVDVRRFGSQGQQRTAALSMRLAELRIIKEETGEDAIVILDDVLSELDAERQGFLIHSFSDNQIFVSATEIGGKMREEMPDAKVFSIEGGRSVPVQR